MEHYFSMTTIMNNNNSTDEYLKGFSAIDEMDKKTPASENSKKVEPTFDNSSFGNDCFASTGSKSETSFDSSDESFKNEQVSTKINESAQNDGGSFLGRILDKIAS